MNAARYAAIAIALFSLAGCPQSVNQNDGGSDAGGGCRVLRALQLPSDHATGTFPGTSLIGPASCGGGAGALTQSDVYSLHVATRAGVRLSTDVPQGTDSVLSLRTDCASRTSELACNDDIPGHVGPSMIRRVLDPGDYFVIVGQFGVARAGGYGLDVGTFDIAANATCATAQPVTDGVRLSGQDMARAGDPPPSCAVGRGTSTLYYSITVPAGMTLSVTATAAATDWTPSLGVLGACDTGTTCLAQSGFGAMGSPPHVDYTNRTGAPVNTIIAVSGTPTTATAPFDLAVDLLPPPPNATCANAISVANGTMLTMQNALLASDSLASACLPTATGPVLYYRATVPAGELLRATATPTTQWTPVLRVLPACGATQCLASRSGFANGPQLVNYLNDTTAALDVILAVGSMNVMFSGTFDLSISIGLPTYLEAQVPAACDDMTTGTEVPNTRMDDSVSPTQALPFAFPFYGETASMFAVSTNGLLLLDPGTLTPGTVGLQNAPIPAATAPNGFVAPYWDDLQPVAGGASPGRALMRVVTGTPRHMTVQWTDFVPFGSPDADMTFQAKLFDDGAIEFHYCALRATATGNVTGGSASIGIESPTGTDGAEHSFNRAASVDTAHALRFTPR